MKSDTYKNLQQQLEQQYTFPIVYLFKFIIPADNHKLALVENLFGKEAIVTTRTSKNGKFISISAKETMLNAKEVIAVYKKAEKIAGIISL